jgi:iron-sulfur cluster assembly protein
MINFTEGARNKIKKLITAKGYAGIRIAIKTTGCSGLAYVLEYVREYRLNEGDINFAQQDFVVLVNRRDEVYLLGLTVDYVRRGLNEGFEFINPNERDRCGCGESFRV